MFGLHSKSNEYTCGLIIDIGSGSVAATIVISDPEEKDPEIIWTKREYILIKDITSVTAPLEEIQTSIITVFLQLQEGLKKLHKLHPKIPITHIQTTISAPWNYIATKTIVLNDEKPFEVNQKLIGQLSKTAERDVHKKMSQNEILQNTELEIIDSATIHITVNGYPMTKLENVQSKNVCVTHMVAMTYKKILSTLEDSINKMLPRAKLTIHSFMYIFYQIIREKEPNISEFCLIDITSEATEIGIVREKALTQVTNNAFGTYSIIREIAALCNIPKEEVLTYIRGGEHFIEAKLTEAKKEELNCILEAYQDKVAELFKRTGDTLAVPQTIFLHCDQATENFFKRQIEAAMKKAANQDCEIHLITSELFNDINTSDTAILLSTAYFHRTIS